MSYLNLISKLLPLLKGVSFFQLNLSCSVCSVQSEHLKFNQCCGILDVYLRELYLHKFDTMIHKAFRVFIEVLLQRTLGKLVCFLSGRIRQQLQRKEP